MASLPHTENITPTEHSTETSSLIGFSRISLVLIFGTKQLFEQIDVPSVFACIGLLFVTSLNLLHIIALCYSKYRLHRVAVPDSSLPGVSIIKPIIGMDDNLYENVESFFTTAYHQLEILFCFNSKNDPAVQVVISLIKKYPAVDAKLFFGGEKVGLNPKINNMMPAYRAARFPLIMISDSAIFMRSDGILDMASTMMAHEKMALVTQTPYCKDRNGLEAAFEQVFFGTSHARIYLAGNCMGFVCPTGMSSMIRKSALDECGGFESFGDYLAEDYFFGRELSNRGYKSAISTHPALQNSASVSFASFVDRIGRWVKLRMAMLPHIILVEPLQDCFSSGLIASICLNYLFGIETKATFVLHTVFWFSMDFLLISRMQNAKLSFPFIQYAFVWFLRELTAPLVFLKAVLNPNVRWRDNTFHLAWGGRIIPQDY